MPEDQRARIKNYIKAINKTVVSEDEALLDTVLGEVADRVMLYLNDTKIDSKLEHVIARIASGVFNQSRTESTSGAPTMAISSVSDNGQSVSYSSEVQRYLTSATDQELFTGFEQLLKRYRRINVVAD